MQISALLFSNPVGFSFCYAGLLYYKVKAKLLSKTAKARLLKVVVEY
jgi:hypothetical protein